MGFMAIKAGRRRIDGAAFEKRVLMIASGLAGIGVAAGDAVALLMRNDTCFLEATFAIQHLGAYAVPLNWHCKADELLYIIEDCAAKILIVHADLLRGLRPRLPDMIAVIAVATPDHIAEAFRVPHESRGVPAGLRAWDRWIDEQTPMQAPTQPAPESLIYTSGTTGSPKGVRRKAQTSEQAILGETMRARVFGIGAGARVLVAAPLYHTAPNLFASRAIRKGELLVLPPRFDPEGLLQHIERHAMTHLYAVPTMFARMLNLPERMRRRYDLSSLSFVLHAGGPCPPAVKRAMIEWLGPIINEYYGSTEHGPLSFSTSADWLARPGTVGRAAPSATISIQDDTGLQLPPGEVGEVLGHNAACSDFTYLHREGARAELQRGDLLMTGDLGYLDADGYLFLCDRKRDMVISGGVNIYPAEIESVLMEHDGVADCVVFGIPHPEFGEAVMAIVEPQHERQLDPEMIRVFLAGRLASYKVPARIEVRQGLPREESGKIRKRLLRDPYWQGAGRTI
ncbi:long-chain acyl-CoA synthetase [Rhizobiales bacterium GAS191]|jgi:long-chain acyl-CoA synthetase|nr:long-chain acyl-CoA synthetase [Rhizobiales bacterium GAS191]